jgi:hypothetical protein
MIEWRENEADPHTHSIEDGVLRYYFVWPEGMTANEIASEFLRTYHVSLGEDEPVPTIRGSIEDRDGNTVHHYSGLPGDVWRKNK